MCEIFLLFIAGIPAFQLTSLSQYPLPGTVAIPITDDIIISFGIITRRGQRLSDNAQQFLEGFHAYVEMNPSSHLHIH